MFFPQATSFLNQVETHKLFNLIPLSPKGKVIINKHGRLWFLMEERNAVAFDDRKGKWRRFESVFNPDHGRWILEGDKDFRVEESNEKH